ncbi:MAG TPA: hypothetical protein VFP80_10730 [Thermoanaerobaculia bacterium]|nr:hypothetical protein [Thermoanaerobaculia bacterium]
MRSILAPVLLLASAIHAGEPMCGTSPENDRRAAALHERTRARIASSGVADTRAALLREGAFYVQNDETITPGYRPFDLDGQSLVFTPAGNAAFTMRRGALQYVEPAGEPFHDFAAAAGQNRDSIDYSLPFAFPLFGSGVTRIWVSAFNGIHTSEPAVVPGQQFRALQAAVSRGPLLSPLLLPSSRPGNIALPRVWIENRAGAVIVTFRSSRNQPFGYDVQVKLARDGTVTYSYRSLTALRFGTPVLAPGLDPLSVARTTLRTAEDPEGDLAFSPREALRPMLDVRKMEVQRLADAELFAVRMTLAGPIDPTKLAEGEVLRYEARLTAFDVALVEIDRTGMRVIPFGGSVLEDETSYVRVDGNVLEVYGLQSAALDAKVRVSSYLELSRRVDSLTVEMLFPAAARSMVTDLSAAAQDARLGVPIVEPFVLGEFDPYRVWSIVRTAYGLSAWDYDAVAMYQTFYTDLILSAGAYAIGGNPQVEGIAPFNPFKGVNVSRSPTLLHMNQLTYGYGRAEDSASKVLLHEFGHRWLYFITILEDRSKKHSLNPLGAHPAAYVHAPSAFPVYGEQESSVMGGGYFTPRPDGSYVAHAAAMGYSWTDLYLMGLAAPEEVPPWFYLTGTDLPGAYWPAEGAVATGQKREVHIGQITAAHGLRIPSVALSQRQFRVLFVLVTEHGQEPTDAEVAKLNEWRRVMERNFGLATGGRGRLITTFVRPDRRRAS